MTADDPKDEALRVAVAAAMLASDASVGSLVLPLGDYDRLADTAIRMYQSCERSDVLCGLAEAAVILGVSRQRAHQLRANKNWPRPVAQLRATPVWSRSDIESFAAGRKTKPGPVAHVAVPGAQS